jgi:hypothetical protein
MEVDEIDAMRVVEGATCAIYGTIRSASGIGAQQRRSVVQNQRSTPTRRIMTPRASTLPP